MPADLAARRELGDGRVEHRLLDVGDHDPRALVEERLDDAAADAVGAAGDDRDLAAHLTHASAAPLHVVLVLPPLAARGSRRRS